MTEHGRSIGTPGALEGLRSPREVAEHIAETMSDLQDSLTRIRETALGLLQYGGPAGRRAQSTDLAVLQPHIESVLDVYRDWTCGAGFVAEPGVLADCTYWLEWRTTSKHGTFSRLEARLGESDFAKYDYFRADWFRRPREGFGPTLTGPYVDLGGVNKYLVTLSIPVHGDGLFLGIVGADILVDRVEGMLRKVGRSMTMAATIVNEAGRVVAATVPRLHPGTLIHSIDLTVDDGESAAPGVRAYRCGSLPWTLLVAPSDGPVLDLLRGTGPGPR